MSEVKIECVRGNLSEDEWAIGEIIIRVFQQKRQDLESQQSEMEKVCIALDQVAITRDYFLENAEKHKLFIARENNVADATPCETIETLLDLFHQKDQLIKCGEKTYKLNVNTSLYKFLVEEFGY